MYIVQLRHDGDGLAEPMAQIRTWLDHQGIQPDAFRLSVVAGGTIFCLEFKTANAADAFVRAFGGKVMGVESTGSVVA